MIWSTTTSCLVEVLFLWTLGNNTFQRVEEMLSSSGMYRLTSVFACKALGCLYQVCHLADIICGGGVTIDGVIKRHWKKGQWHWPYCVPRQVLYSVSDVCAWVLQSFRVEQITLHSVKVYNIILKGSHSCKSCVAQAAPSPPHSRRTCGSSIVRS